MRFNDYNQITISRNIAKEPIQKYTTFYIHEDLRYLLMKRAKPRSWTSSKLLTVQKEHYHSRYICIHNNTWAHIFVTAKIMIFFWEDVWYVTISLSWKYFDSNEIQILFQIWTLLMKVFTTFKQWHISSLKAEKCTTRISPLKKIRWIHSVTYRL